MSKLLYGFREHQVSKEPTLKSNVPVHCAHCRAEGLQAHLLVEGEQSKMENYRK
jgi:hypothetical protein